MGWAFDVLYLRAILPIYSPGPADIQSAFNGITEDTPHRTITLNVSSVA